MREILRRLGGATPATVRVMVMIALSLAMMLIDNRTQQFEKLRNILQTVVYPVMFISTIPREMIRGVTGTMETSSNLQTENESLRQENLLLHSRLEKLHSLEADNRRLKRLLGQSEQIAEHVLLAELVEVSLEPYTQQISLNKGSSDDVYVGQPVINGDGVIGQVVHTSQFQSTVTLLTDPGSAIPVMVMRNGLRGVLFGTGVRNKLAMPYMTADADIRVGDLLISSGMGGRFPTGYPVATVTEVIQQPSDEFLTINTLPVTQLDHGREVLLIWPETTKSRAFWISRRSSPMNSVPILVSFLVAMMLTSLPLPESCHHLSTRLADTGADLLVYGNTRTDRNIHWLVAGAFAGRYVWQPAGAKCHGIFHHCLPGKYPAFTCADVPLWQQSVMVFLLVILHLAISAWIRGIAGQFFVTWTYWMPALTSALVWPFIFIVLRDIRRQISSK